MPQDPLVVELILHAYTCRGASLPDQVDIFSKVLISKVSGDASEMSLEECDALSAASLVAISRSEDVTSGAAIAMAAINSLHWPQYNHGDGYWTGASELATQLTLMALNDHAHTLIPSLLTMKQSHSRADYDALGFVDLGIVANMAVDRDTVLQVAKRAGIDPVTVVAMAHPALSLDDQTHLYDLIENFDWLVNLLRRTDGWTWPDYQSAFEQASFTVSDEQLVPIWLLILATYCRDNGSLPLNIEIPLPTNVGTAHCLEMLDECWRCIYPNDEKPDPWLDSLCLAVINDSLVTELARSIDWAPAKLALVRSGKANDRELAQLAVHDSELVRKAVAGVLHAQPTPKH